MIHLTEVTGEIVTVRVDEQYPLAPDQMEMSMTSFEYETEELTIEQLQEASGGDIPLRGYGPSKTNMSPWGVNAPHDPYWVLTGPVAAAPGLGLLRGPLPARLRDFRRLQWPQPIPWLGPLVPSERIPEPTGGE